MAVIRTAGEIWRLAYGSAKRVILSPAELFGGHSMNFNFFILSVALLWLTGALIVVPFAYWVVYGSTDFTESSTLTKKEEFWTMILFSWVSIIGVVFLIAELWRSDEFKRDFKKEVEAIKKNLESGKGGGDD